MNIIKYCSFILLYSITFSAAAEKSKTSSLPLSVDTVEVHRVNKQLVRIIQYNRIELPLLEIELIKVPGRQLLDIKPINAITVIFNDRDYVLNFEERAAVDFENIRADDKKIYFKVGFTAAAHTSPYIVSSCEVWVGDGVLSEPECYLLKWGSE